MERVPDTDSRAYLLGRMPEADAEQFEARLLQDADVFQAVREAEHDLFDAFARGELGADDRERFLARFRGEAGRLAFSRALAQRVRQERSLGGARPSRFTWIPLAAAAAIVLIAGAALVLRSKPEPGRVPAAQVPTAGAPASAAPPLVVALSMAVSRAAGDTASVSLPAAAPALQLRVRLNPADKYDRYTMELRSQANRVVWRGDDLKAAVEAGDLVVSGTIPAASLDAGTYELAVRGGADDLGFVPVRIMRTP